MQQCEDKSLVVEKRTEEVRRDAKKQAMAILKEFEKLQSQVDRKCTLEEFNTRMESKIDKQMALGILN